MSFSRRHILLRAIGSAAALSTPWVGHTNPLQPHLNAPRLVGQGKFSYWGFDVYVASLWSDASVLRADQWHTQRLALELNYLRDFEGKAIAKRSIDEMQQQSPLPPERARAWASTLEALFPDVRKGQRLTGIYVPGNSAHFLFNDKPLGSIADAELAQRFFAIWLAPNTSAPALRQQLLADK